MSLSVSVSWQDEGFTVNIEKGFICHVSGVWCQVSQKNQKKIRNRGFGNALGVFLPSRSIFPFDLNIMNVVFSQTELLVHTGVWDIPVSLVMCHISGVTCHLLCALCHVSCVMSHVSCVMCHVSCVMCHM